jgi:hypothetical protein
MKNLITFENFRNPYIDRKAMSGRPKQYVNYIKEPVEIRLDIEKIQHAGERQTRHVGSGDAKISNDDITESVELAIEELTIALMQDKFSINQEVDDYPTRGVKAGEPNRFIIRNLSNDLNIVCQLEAGDNEFTLTVITVMVTPDFRGYKGQYVIEVES